MASSVVPAIPASQLVDVVPSVLATAGSPLQFWGLLVDDNLDANGYPLMPMGSILNFADASDVASYFGSMSQEAGLSDVYFTAPINATRVPSGLLAAPYALNAVPGFLRSGSLSSTSLATLQAINDSLTITIDATPDTQTIDLSTATSYSNAATLIGSQLGIAGVQLGSCTAALDNATSHMTVSAFSAVDAQGPVRAVVTANLSDTTMTVTDVTGGYLEVGQIVTGTGITAGTTIDSWDGTGVPGGIGSYTLSASATTEVDDTITAYDLEPVIVAGQVVTGTGLPSGTYITGQVSGTPGGEGVYSLSAAPTTESAEAVALFAPGCSYNSNLHTFDIHSGTAGSSSVVSFGTGAAAPLLLLTQATGAVQSLGTVASSPASFMDVIVSQTQNWVSFMTTWEPTDADKSTAGLTGSFAGWCSAQGNEYRYCMWETDVLDTEPSEGSASSAAINASGYSGTVMIYENPDRTTLAGEKAAFMMSWAASLDFTRLNGRQTAAFKSYAGGLPDITSGTIAQTLAGSPQGGTYGYGINFYGQYTTRSQGFPQYQRGLISGSFVWDDSYVNQIWLNASLQNDIMVGLTNVGSVPYANPGYATIESWCLDAILAGVNFGAIVAGVQLSQAQIQAVNTAAGLVIDTTLTQRGWYLQVSPAPAATRANRTSPPCTLWYCDGGSIQAITLASIEVQ